MINTKQIIIASLLVIFSIGLLAAPQAFADHDEVTIQNAAGSSTPGCEDTADGCFIPNVVTLSKADTEVTWENNDTAAHTASAGTPTDGLSGHWDSSLIMAGGSYTVSFEDYEPGTYPYHCMVHPWMAGTIIVEDGTSSTPADTVPPQVLVPDDITLQTEDQNGASATFNPQAIDNIDELITPTCSPASGSVFAIGTTEVVCTATDSSGNTSSNSFNVIIECPVCTFIPQYVKNVAGWWFDGSVNDASFLEAISYLINHNIIIIPTTESGTGGGVVPDWVKNNAGWWFNGIISDDEFLNGITYLIEHGFIQVD